MQPTVNGFLIEEVAVVRLLPAEDLKNNVEDEKHNSQAQIYKNNRSLYIPYYQFITMICAECFKK